MAKKTTRQLEASAAEHFAIRSEDMLEAHDDLSQPIDTLAFWLDEQLEQLEQRFRGFVTNHSLRREIRHSR